MDNKPMALVLGLFCVWIVTTNPRRAVVIDRSSSLKDIHRVLDATFERSDLFNLSDDEHDRLCRLVDFLSTREHIHDNTRRILDCFLTHDVDDFPEGGLVYYIQQ